MAFFDKAIPPGGEGRITLNVKTKGYRGRVRKTARVITNDPQRSILRIRMDGFVKVSIYVSSRYVHLIGNSYKKISKNIQVRAEMDRPLELTPVFFNLAGKVSYNIQEIEKGRKFQIHFETIPGNLTSFRGVLRLKTNYPEKPEIYLQIRGRFK